MNALTSVIGPVIISGTALYGFYKKIDIFTALTDGGREGMKILYRIVPTLIGLLCGVAMLRASGALELLTWLLSPVLSFFGVPEACAPLVVLRPFSGSGGLAAATDIIKSEGPDSLAGRMAAVILASSETTFYTAAIYFGAAGVTKTRYALPAAMISEFTAFVVSALAVNMFWG